VRGWSWGGVAKRCETHLKEIIEGNELDITTNGHGAVVWTTTIVFNGYGLADPVGAAADAAMQLKQWVTAIRHSPEADAYRKASNARPAFSLAALHFLDPVIHGPRIRKVRRCQICFSPRAR
jgi:hypothetical protein